MAEAEALYKARLQRDHIVLDIIPRDGDCLPRSSALFTSLRTALLAEGTGAGLDCVTAELQLAKMNGPSPLAGEVRGQIVQGLAKRASDPSDPIGQNIDGAMAEVVNNRAMQNGTTM